MGPPRALVLAALLLPACTGPPARDRVVVAFPSGPSSLIPDAVNEEFTISVLSNVYEGLTEFDARLTVQPGLADSWYTTDDLTWVVKLRSGARFHDGRPVEASQVAACLERARSDPGSKRRAELVSVKSIQARDASTLVIETHYPFGALPHRLAVVSIWTDSLTPGGRPMGTGPFAITDWRPAGNTVMEAFAGYYRGPAPVRNLEFRVVPQPEERVALLRRGEVHLVVDVPVDDVDALRGTPGMKVLAERGLRVIFLVMDTARPHTAEGARNPFRDVAVRRATAYAIDRQALVKGPLGGFGEIVDQIVAPGVFGYHPGLRPLPFAPGQARDLLAAAGYPRGFETSLDFMPRKYQAVEKVVAALVSGLAAVGIRVTPRPSDTTEFFARVERRENSFALMGWMTTGGDAAASYNYLLHTPSQGYGLNNGGGYSNPEVDALMETAARTLPPDQRFLALAAMTEKVQADVPVIPLYRQVDLYGVAAGLEFQPRVDRRIRGHQLRWARE